MYEGTLYGHWQAIVTLQQMLVLCNSEGVVDMTPQAMAARTSIPLDIIQKGIETLTEPDPYSRTPGDEGRRIILIDAHRPWGWFIVNYAKYQQLRNREEKLEADRRRIAEKRKVNKNIDVADCRKESQPVAEVAPKAIATTTPKEKQSHATRGTRLPADWVLPRAWGEWAIGEQPSWTSEHTRKVADKFRDYWIAQSGQKGVMLDWEATWRNWVRREGAMKVNGCIVTATHAFKPCARCQTPLKGGHTSTSIGNVCNHCYSLYLAGEWTAAEGEKSAA